MSTGLNPPSLNQTRSQTHSQAHSQAHSQTPRAENPSPWLNAQGLAWNPAARVSHVPLPGGGCCVVVDDALAHPEGLVQWAADQAAQQRFAPPQGYPYPGLVLGAPAALVAGMADQFSLHARTALGGRRTRGSLARLSLVTTPPAQLAPVQWLCHRDRVADDPRQALFAAAVLYLFHNPALGGTSFFVPRQGRAATDQLLADSQQLDAQRFTQRYGLQPGYTVGSNAFFERVATVGAVWNRAIFYDGGVFHSADVDQPALLCADPLVGRLTLNGFFTCTRAAQG